MEILPSLATIFATGIFYDPKLRVKDLRQMCIIIKHLITLKMRLVTKFVFQESLNRQDR